MLNLLRSIFNSSPPIDLSFEMEALDLRSKPNVVLMWEALFIERERLGPLRFEYDKNNQSYLRPFMEAGRRMRLIETSCIYMHKRDNLPVNHISHAGEKLNGVDLSRRLRNYDDESIDALHWRILNVLATQYQAIAASIVATNVLENIDKKSPENTVRQTLSFNIWLLLSAFYEQGITIQQGSPRNIYVSTNVRVMFANIISARLLKDGFVDTSTEWVMQMIGAFLEERGEILSGHWEGRPNHVNWEMHHSHPSGVDSEFTSDIAEVLHREVAQFCKSEQRLFDNLVAGRI